jgi:hypothetical protein
LNLTVKVWADELQTILGHGTRIGMAVPGDASKGTGNGRKEEKSIEEGYGTEGCHL